MTVNLASLCNTNILSPNSEQYICTQNNCIYKHIFISLWAVATILTGLECSTVKNSGLIRNFTGGDWSNKVSLDLEVEWGSTFSLRKSKSKVNDKDIQQLLPEHHTSKENIKYTTISDLLRIVHISVPEFLPTQHWSFWKYYNFSLVAFTYGFW